MSVEDLLVQVGLGHLAPAFQGISMERFKSLLIQDYDKYGIRDVVEKQALFKVIKSLNAEEFSLTLSPEPSMSNVSSQANSSPEPLARYGLTDAADAEGGAGGDDLLALDGSDDDDFLQTFSDAFAQSLTPERLAAASGGAPISTSISTSAAASATTPAPAPQGETSVGTPFTQQPRLPLSPIGRQNNTISPASAAMNQLDRTTSTAASAGTPNAKNDVAAVAAIADPPRIRVIVRKRPLNKKEIERGDNDVLQCDSENATLYVHEPKTKVDLTKYTESHAFCFDDVFDEAVDNDEVYQRAIRPLIATLFRAGKGTCFAYGQTGSGKTYTMGPLPLRAAADIFAVMGAAPEYNALSLHVACYEIYGGKVFDLLNTRQRLEVREDAKRRVQVVGLKEVEVKNIDVLMKLCDHAACARSTGQTGANDESSRSHSIMVFSLRAPKPAPPTGPGVPPRSLRTVGQQKPDGPELKTIGKLSFIDLAGSERGADTYDNDKQTRLEGAEINKSLLALKECIRALDAEAKHIPFRGSKLTEVLRDSFIGKNARTVMIANVSPNSTSCEHTLNTLRYADRVKEIKKDGGKPIATTVPTANGAGTVGSEAQPTISNGVNAVAALLQKLPPPSIPAVGGGVQQNQQQERQQLSSGLDTKRLPSSRAPQAVTPLSPTKLRTPGLGSVNDGTATTPASTIGKGGSRPSAAQINGNLPAIGRSAAATPGRDPLPLSAAGLSPPVATLNPSSAAKGTSPANCIGGPPRRSGSLTAHPLHPTLSDASHSSGPGPLIPEVDDAVLGILMAAEEDLIAAHRSHIESTMSTVREEMELLSQLDASSGNTTTVESYVEELSNILVEKAAGVAALQQQVAAFKRQLKAVTAKTNGA